MSSRCAVCLMLHLLIDTHPPVRIHVSALQLGFHPLPHTHSVGVAFLDRCNARRETPALTDPVTHHVAPLLTRGWEAQSVSLTVYLNWPPVGHLSKLLLEDKLQEKSSFVHICRIKVQFLAAL